MLRIRTLALGAAMIVGFAGAATAQSTQGDRAARRAMRQPGAEAQGRLLQGITLTDAQKAQVKTINEQHRTELRAIRGQGAGRPDSAQRAAARELARKHHQQLRAVLTAEQQVTFDKNVAAALDRWEDRRDTREDRREARRDSMKP